MNPGYVETDPGVIVGQVTIFFGGREGGSPRCHGRKSFRDNPAHQPDAARLAGALAGGLAHCRCCDLARNVLRRDNAPSRNSL
jgi:hypothetical protein